MGLQQKLKSMKDDRDAEEHIKHTYSAKEWRVKLWSIEERKILDSIMQKLFDKDIIFSEEKQSEIELTINELLINSISACKEKSDALIDLDVHYSNNGLLIHVRDNGPGFNHREMIRKRRESSKYMGIKRFREIVITSDKYKGGTGLYCLIHYAGNFQFNDRGNEVTARFEL